mmetsp:Transcript_68606/g.148050  ORF Transcript_68606/g.148050 Transcript_68606/m.148050 type:complete len:167 (-) Transcript_68606:377-877(-)
MLNQFVAGGIAGAFSKSVVAPLDRVKILLQINSDMKTSSFRLAADILQTQGLQAFWRGNVANVVRIFPKSALGFGFFDTLKTKLTQDKTLSSTQIFFRKLLSGVISGLITGTVCYPLDMARNRMAADMSKEKRYKSMTHCLSTMIREEGPLSIFKGYIIMTLSFVP